MKLINIKDCRVENNKSILLKSVFCEFNSNEAWVIVGPNGGGKAAFLNALVNQELLAKNSVESELEFKYTNSTEIVSLERAAQIIQQERENDESEYVEGGVDIGRTGRIFISEVLLGKTNLVNNLENLPQIKLCGVEQILDRGLKYMSTGEIRRVLLSRALLSNKKQLILSDPFAGLDVDSRKILFSFFNNVVENQTNEENDFPYLILSMERWHEIPENITHVLEFSNKEISFCGKRSDYEKKIKKVNKKDIENQIRKTEEFSNTLKETIQERKNLTKEKIDVNENKDETEKKLLIQMKNVNVSWGENHVIRNLSWTLYENEHWLIRGPNGSGKTTFLELITGDNKQVYCNDVWIFGIKRGSGESIWDIKKELGVVSYRMHVEYRMLGGTSLQNVIISGFRDSIGLYGLPTDVEIMAAKKWLNIGGFCGREYENFGDLSYGEQRMILIMRSVVKNPKILILDEPCHGLDENSRQKVLSLLEVIANQRITTILHVTHDVTEVMPFEKHILELKLNERSMYEIKEMN